MITVGGRKTKTIELRITSGGCWEARATYEGKPITGRVLIDWRGWIISGGEVDQSRSRAFAGEPSAVIVGGLSWTITQVPKTYQDDRGVLAGTILQALAASLGQTLVLDTNPSLGRYYMRRNESGGQLMSRIYGVGRWFVGTDGVTRTGARSSANAGKSVAVLSDEPTSNRVPLYADRPDQCLPGSRIAATSRHGSFVVTDLFVKAANKERITAYVRAA